MDRSTEESKYICVRLYVWLTIGCLMRSIVIIVFLLAVISPAMAESVAVGVLAYDGKPQALERWQPTADYLSRRIPSREFRMVPLTHQELEHSINRGELDFILTNPGHYVLLEVRYGVTRIATFKSRFHDSVLTHFSSVIFTRSDAQIDSIHALKGKTLAAVSESAFGGFQLAQDALLSERINVRDDMQLLWLGFPHSAVVRAVLNGDADAGTVRSGVLEKMAARGELDLARIKILARRETPGFPLLHSVDLYPEWPFSKLPDTDDTLAKEVAITLLKMPEDDPATLQSGGAGWTIPLDYSAIHTVLRRLQVAPYPPEALDLSAFWRAYQGWIIALCLLFSIALASLLRLVRAKRRLEATQQSLHRHQASLEARVEQRTRELSELNHALLEDVARRIRSEQLLNEGCEVLQSLYAISVRHDLDRAQRLQSIVDLARHFMGAEHALLSSYRDDCFETCTASPDLGRGLAPLNPSLARAALSDSQLSIHRDAQSGEDYVACPVFVEGELLCLLEFTSSQQYRKEHRREQSQPGSELSQRILKLISQWVGNEVALAQGEKQSLERQREIGRRFAGITPRERDVLTLLVQSESTKSMAKLLHISTKTVELHRANLLRKTGAKSSIELVKLAVQAGFDLAG